MKKSLAIFSLSFAALISNSLAHANPWWVDIGGGASDLGLAAGADVNVMLSAHQLITVRALGSGQISLLTDESVGDVGLLYGLIEKGKYTYISASAGLAYTKATMGLTFFNSSSVEANTVGIPLEVNLGFTPTQHLGAAIKLFANINRVQPVYGGMLELQFGNLRFA